IANGKGRVSEREGDTSHAGSDGGLPEVRRGAGQGRGGARGRQAAPELAGQAGSVRRQEAYSHRRTVRGDQGACGRILALAGAVDRRGPRVAEAGTLRRRYVRDP